MGRKNPLSLGGNKDGYERLNFLYQAACMTIAANPSNAGLARFYAQSMKAVARKLVIKLDPSIKRTICKYCHSLLIPGVTSKVRTKAKREKHIIESCLCCGKVKRYLARKDHTLWSEQEKPDKNKKI